MGELHESLLDYGGRPAGGCHAALVNTSPVVAWRSCERSSSAMSTATSPRSTRSSRQPRQPVRWTACGAWATSLGYGPWPLETVRLVRSLGAVCIQGNHDAGAIGRVSLDTFNYAAREACRWNGAQLDEDARSFLRSLPDTAAVAGFTLVHGTPRDPLWEYLTGYADAMEGARQLSRPATFSSATRTTSSRSRRDAACLCRGRVA